MKPIYKPKGKAREYAEWALNIYTGCTNRCSYCYAPAVLHKTRKEFFSHVEPRPDLLDALEKQLSDGSFAGETIHLCFTCDPYPYGVITTATYRVIEELKSAGCHVQMLTKRPEFSKRDWHMLDGNDWIGTTFTGADPWDAGDPKYVSYLMHEPWSENERTRYEALKDAKAAGLRTWASCEPVVDPDAIYHLIEIGDCIDLFKIGKLNYFKSDIYWAEFGKECIRLCEQYGCKYQIKESLLSEINKADCTASV